MNLNLETLTYLAISFVLGIGVGVFSSTLQDKIRERKDRKKNHINRIKNDIFIPWSNSHLRVEQYGEGAKIILLGIKDKLGMGDWLSYENFKEEREFSWAEQHLRAYPKIFSHWNNALEVLPKIDEHVKATRKMLTEKLKTEMGKNFPFLSPIDESPTEENTYSVVYTLDKMWYYIDRRASYLDIKKDLGKRFKKEQDIDIVTLDGTNVIKSSEFNDNDLNTFIEIFNRMSSDDEFINRIKKTKEMEREIEEELNEFNQGLKSLIKDIEDNGELKGKCEKCSILVRIKMKYLNTK